MSVWIVDDETNLANGLKRAFERKGHSVECLGSVAELYDALLREYNVAFRVGFHCRTRAESPPRC